MRLVVKPLARELWPEWVDPTDCDETYGFVVRYRIGEDVELAEHADTSNVTLNVCLGKEFTGGELYFKGVRFTPSQDDHQERPVFHSRGSAIVSVFHNNFRQFAYMSEVAKASRWAGVGIDLPPSNASPPSPPPLSSLY
ncbi:ICU11 [Symbiodinium pilosum]|uniref:ICU11 protein n=1 Tax=Symbiodinium pilosum TaxID=2952 RepID=A0A812WPQ3_SYMPI|nr:ICU11 [Symbiodinium pilosum]